MPRLSNRMLATVLVAIGSSDVTSEQCHVPTDVSTHGLVGSATSRDRAQSRDD